MSECVVRWWLVDGDRRLHYWWVRDRLGINPAFHHQSRKYRRNAG